MLFIEWVIVDVFIGLKFFRFFESLVLFLILLVVLRNIYIDNFMILFNCLWFLVGSNNF